MIFLGAMGMAASIERREGKPLRRYRWHTNSDPAMSNAESLRITREFASEKRSKVGDGFPGYYYDKHVDLAKQIESAEQARADRLDGASDDGGAASSAPWLIDSITERCLH